jgi:hypothetical protein
MARKVDRKADPSAADSSAAEQLGVLNPTLAITIAGRDIVVREYEFFDGLEVAQQAEAFIADMHRSCKQGGLRYTKVRRLFGVHRDVVTRIAARAAQVEIDWVRGLKGADAETFLSAWFSVNAGFFVHEVGMELREEQQLAALARSMGGTTSSPASAPPAMATSGPSGGTPNAS